MKMTHRTRRAPRRHLAPYTLYGHGEVRDSAGRLSLLVKARPASSLVQFPTLEVLPEHRMADGRVMLEWSGDLDRGDFKARLIPRAELEATDD